MSCGELELCWHRLLEKREKIEDNIRFWADHRLALLEQRKGEGVYMKGKQGQ